MNQDPWQRFFGPNLGYVLERYEKYKEGDENVDPELKDLFERWGPPKESEQQVNKRESRQESQLETVVRAVQFAEAIRAQGHLAAKINPLTEDQVDNDQLFNEKRFNLSKSDLRALPGHILSPHLRLQNAEQVIARLKEVYTQSMAFEFEHVHVKEEKEWLTKTVESGDIFPALSKDEKVPLLERLIEVEEFETFLHQTFVGQKRFSIEGLDTLIPLLDEGIKKWVEAGINNIVIGMAHRGRLNVLAHILGKPYELIFSEFHHSPNKELVPSEGSVGINYGWTGDVKYHLGADRDIKKHSNQAHITLANNPSHLEFVNPVVLGYARAAQETSDEPGFPKQDVNRAVSILIHGDAAFPGEGIVQETLNLSCLRGYQTGGTIHIIANNRIGFTTESSDSRSTKYASDVAKGFEIPIVHVNAENPEACVAAMKLAYLYREKFNKDFVIDLIGLRRYGHNEMDEPQTTQPTLYKQIKKHPSIRKQYAQTLTEEGLVTKETMAQMEERIKAKLKQAYEKIEKVDNQSSPTLSPPKVVKKGFSQVATNVQYEKLQKINSRLLQWPEQFSVFPKLEKILKRRERSFTDGGKVDWAHAETLAFAAILQDGIPIRMTGQDVERGTFAHRHLVLHDYQNGQSYSPLHLLQNSASFAIYNSPLSEAGVLGFEYGYNIQSPATLVIWEAQFGDFTNAAQVIIDQFISSGRAKWGQKSGIVMLLPHGYEGQGPEHSSARIERFLELSAEHNWTIANVTTASQYFHLLRRQAAMLTKEEVRPLVVMTPKSLLRHEQTASPYEQFSKGAFEPVIIEQGQITNKQATTLVLASGKVAVDLQTKKTETPSLGEHTQILRIEELYPFPKEQVSELLKQLPAVTQIIWVQEEPKNMGAWTYIFQHVKEMTDLPIRYVGRIARSSPAEGTSIAHKKEQERMVTEALSLK
ncbi:2-oxoglutarate dehydrogenase E1 component [Alkalihalobacillus sp. LMS39]|uniref:2-oxoglutarate dehydrogenase E1 component n=1 Tax=Alkalihalobacillus sp. LMS39 TaxID=2924032 RepID=UPI001FB45BAE|nr:2-oxoglutarate dehydrogenase E1 component [Alkalihalobacillus sp. LMS39]UOE92589.1 2-oxoglutarate dehydrogenase E1 component [Alkalihalobacillus sp. LMS39]